jgi:hypothetical protein
MTGTRTGPGKTPSLMLFPIVICPALALLMIPPAGPATLKAIAPPENP